MSAWLTPAEIIDLTARKRWSAQCRALAALGLPFRLNAAGRPLVERAAVLHYDTSKPARSMDEPNWAAMENFAQRGNAQAKR